MLQREGGREREEGRRATENTKVKRSVTRVGGNHDRELKKNERKREKERVRGYGRRMESEFIRSTVRKIIPKLITPAGYDRSYGNETRI